MALVVKSQAVKSQKTCTIRESIDNQYNNNILYIFIVLVRFTFYFYLPTCGSGRMMASYMLI